MRINGKGNAQGDEQKKMGEMNIEGNGFNGYGYSFRERSGFEKGYGRE